MTAEAPVLRQHGNSYNIFILVLTIFSLAVMVLLLLPITPAERDLLTLYDNAVCVVFLIDFAMNLAGSKPKRAYFLGQRGWLDLLGSVPSFGVFQVGALFRLARLSRLARISRLLRGNNRKMLVKDVLDNRGQYATFITILLAGIVLSVGSILVLEFESRSVDPAPNIKTGGDAIWWGIVTITTVGYGDRFPVTFMGRITGVFVMFAGIGIIGALASILASLLVSPAGSSAAVEAGPGAGGADGDDAGAGPANATGGAAVGLTAGAADIAAELSRTRAEMAATRAEMAALRRQVIGMARLTTDTEAPQDG
jgi:voltage-gated potassium channel